MASVCLICNTEENLNEVPGRIGLFVCNDHLSDYIDKQAMLSVRDNDICKDCLFNQVSFIYIGVKPFEKYCCACASTFITNTPGGDKMFISINWKNIVKNSELDEYRTIKAKVKAIKNKCNDFCESFDKQTEELELERYTSDIFGKIDEYFDEKIDEIRDYQKSYTDTYKKVMKDMKKFIIDGNKQPYLDETKKINESMCLKLLKNKNLKRSLEFIDLVKIENTLDTTKSDFFFEINLKPLNELIQDEFMLVFIDDNINIFELSFRTQEVKLYNGPEFQLWKPNPCWCDFENGDNLYTGGGYNKKDSGICFLENPRKGIHYSVGKCTPRQGHTITTFEDVAYLFGGLTVKCEKFVHKENSWESIADIPKVLDRATSILVNREIYVTGSAIRNIIIYDISKDTFNNSPILIGPGKKLLLKINEKIFILSGKNVYLLDDTTLQLKRRRSDNENKITSIMEPKVFGNSIYWVAEEGDLCCFNEELERTKIIYTKEELKSKGIRK